MNDIERETHMIEVLIRLLEDQNNVTIKYVIKEHESDQEDKTA